MNSSHICIGNTDHDLLRDTHNRAWSFVLPSCHTCCQGSTAVVSCLASFGHTQSHDEDWFSFEADGYGMRHGPSLMNTRVLAQRDKMVKLWDMVKATCVFSFSNPLPAGACRAELKHFTSLQFLLIFRMRCVLMHKSMCTSCSLSLLSQRITEEVRGVCV
jgi:hypothetical protein